MSPEQFCYWLGGYFEISDSKSLSPNQVQIIKAHLDLVFEKVTPNRSDNSSVYGIEALKNSLDSLPKQSGEHIRYC